MTRSIVYVSNVNDDTFPNNTNCEFKSLLKIPEDFFKDINPNNILLVGVRRISFTITKRHGAKTIGITSNIVKVHQIVNNNLSELLWTFCLPSNKVEEESENLSDPQPTTLEIVNDHPIYCESSVQNLKEGSFLIFDTNTKRNINDLVDQSSPTVIEICYKTMSTHNSHFNVFVNSDNLESKKIFSTNNNMDFSILLPKTRQLENGWGIILRDLTMTNQFANVEKEEFYSISYSKYETKVHINSEEGSSTPVKSYTIVPESWVSTKPVYMTSGFYATRKQFIEEVNNKLKVLEAPFYFISTPFQNNRVKIQKKIDLSSTGKVYGRTLLLSYRLAVALGFQLPLNNIEEDAYREHDYNLDLSTVPNQGILGDYPENINYFYPKHIVINCDLLSNSIIGNRQSKVLHLINTTEIQGDMIKFNMKSAIFRDLDVFSFQKIRFWITNLKGEKLKALSPMTTSLSLTFIKS